MPLYDLTFDVIDFVVDNARAFLKSCMRAVTQDDYEEFRLTPAEYRAYRFRVIERNYARDAVVALAQTGVAPPKPVAFDLTPETVYTPDFSPAKTYFAHVVEPVVSGVVVEYVDFSEFQAASINHALENAELTLLEV